MRAMLPILVSLPHCSAHIPYDIRDSIALSERDLKNHCDLYTELIFDIPETFQVKASFSRLVCDPNRSVDDITFRDEDDYAEFISDSIPLHSIDKKPIYHKVLTRQEVERRIRDYHALYHWQLEMYVPMVKFFIDGHSMYNIAPNIYRNAGQQRPDICLGTREGTTCTSEQVAFIKHFFENRGYETAVDSPFQGKYIMERYCSSGRVPGIQIEVNQRFYTDEETLEPKYEEIKKLNKQMTDLTFAFSQEFFPKK